VQVTDTDIVAKLDASAAGGASTLQLETTVAVTMRGVDADCARASAGALVSMAAARIVRRMAFS